MDTLYLHRIVSNNLSPKFPEFMTRAEIPGIYYHVNYYNKQCNNPSKYIYIYIYAGYTGSRTPKHRIQRSGGHPMAEYTRVCSVFSPSSTSITDMSWCTTRNFPSQLSTFVVSFNNTVYSIISITTVHMEFF